MLTGTSTLTTSLPQAQTVPTLYMAAALSFAFGGAAFTIFFLGVAEVSLRAGGLPKWLGFLALLAAAASVFGFVTPYAQSGIFNPATGGLGFYAHYVAFVVWVFLASLVAGARAAPAQARCGGTAPRRRRRPEGADAVSRVWHVIKPFLAGILVLVGAAGADPDPGALDDEERRVAVRAAAGGGAKRDAERAGDGRSSPGRPQPVRQGAECQEGISTPGYFSALNGAELTDASAQRHLSLRRLPRLPDRAEHRLHLQGPGQLPEGPVRQQRRAQRHVRGRRAPARQHGARAPARTWPGSTRSRGAGVADLRREPQRRTTSSSGGTNLNILANGKIVYAWNHRIALLDRDHWRDRQGAEPASPGPVTPNDINYKELTVAPDGTIILRSQNRPENCNQQGGGA